MIGQSDQNHESFFFVFKCFTRGVEPENGDMISQSKQSKITVF